MRVERVREELIGRGRNQMKVVEEAMGCRKRNISISLGGSESGRRNPLSQAEELLGLSLSSTNNKNKKKLRRLPHVFTRVLQLPLSSDADVYVEEAPNCFRFVAEAHSLGPVEAHALQIHPGITKVVVRGSASLQFSSLDDLDLDIWRFRLPQSTRPELATAVFTDDGELIVTVPKECDDDDVHDMWSDDDDDTAIGGGACMVI